MPKQTNANTARVGALLRQCDALEAQLHQTRTLGAHLLASTLHHVSNSWE
jgi:hypothetical protein